jgi:hypothetical protein
MNKSTSFDIDKAADTITKEVIPKKSEKFTNNNIKVVHGETSGKLQ